MSSQQKLVKAKSAQCAQQQSQMSEPIRTVHHFACTGGTIISKCIAAMPHTQLLSEVDPLSEIQRSGKPIFAPTDIITLMRQSTCGVTTDLIIDLFLNNIFIIYAETKRLGQSLILRSHDHSHYCGGTEIPERPNLIEILSSRFPTISLVTVRHPLDSFMSLKCNGWIHFIPKTFDEYCKRYVNFIHAHKKVPIIHYEDFVKSPNVEMSKICSILSLTFSTDFIDLFRAFKLTGDSGRKSDTIEFRPRRKIEENITPELNNSSHYHLLLELLGYDA